MNELLFYIWMGKPLWIWGIFIALISGLLIFDLGVLHRKQREIKVAESLWLSAFYIFMGISYGLWILYYMGETSASEYLTGYLIEKTLSLDNVFVISLIFNYLVIPQKYQHRVLFWGILGVIVLRGIMIVLGAALIEKFDWIAYVFATFLIFTGIKMLIVQESDPDLAKNPLLLFMRRHLRITTDFHGEKFFVRKSESPGGPAKLWVTPLFLALMLVEIADLIFAVDSIPAIFTITRDPYIVYTSNIFAILGLRALYFALAAIIHRFYYLKYSLAIVLIFIGSKPFIAWWLGEEKIPAEISLLVTFLLIVSGIVVSLIKTNTVRETQK